MLAVQLTDLFLEGIEELSTNKVVVTREEVEKILCFCDKLSKVKRGAKTLGDEDIETMQVASFMTPFIRRRFVSWDVKDWTYPDLITDQLEAGTICCSDSQEFNSICTKICKKLKMTMTTTPVGKMAEETSLNEALALAAIGNFVPATYNYEWLPLSLTEGLEVVLGEEYFVKSFDGSRFINAVLTNATMSARIQRTE